MSQFDAEPLTPKMADQAYLRLAGDQAIPPSLAENITQLVSTTIASGELVSVSNTSGDVDQLSPGVALNVSACVLLLPPSDYPIYVTGQFSILQTAVGTGSVSATIANYSDGSFLDSVYLSLPNRVGAPGSLRVTARLNPATSYRRVGLLVSNVADSGQSPSFSIQNSTTGPSRLWGEAK